MGPVMVVVTADRKLLAYQMHPEPKEWQPFQSQLKQQIRNRLFHRPLSFIEFKGSPSQIPFHLEINVGSVSLRHIPTRIDSHLDHPNGINPKRFKMCMFIQK